MKRKEPAGADPVEDTQQSGRRQPQTSCFNCRVKKIKCDRGTPCASCVIRGVSCTGQPGSKPAALPQNNITDSGTNASILSRLASLERAVFGDARHRDAASKNWLTKSLLQFNPATSTQAPVVNTPSLPSHKDTERQQAAKFLDSTYTREDNRVITSQTHRLHFYVAPASFHLRQPAVKYSIGIDGSSRSALIMTREEALRLLRDFYENPYHLLPIIYEPSARSLINTFYAHLDQGHEGDPTAAALILSIASTSASFFHDRDITHTMFASTEEATQASVVWRETALAILDDSRFPINGTLESCQARAILAYAVCNVEGCSARYRFLHSCSIAIARDMSLHLIDSTATTDTSDDIATREIKRRLWWHLASTDWLLGLVGGPLDGTYTIQPRHFMVNRPRNINDNDLNQNDETLTYPLNTLTNVSCFLQRIRLGEISREIIDARPPKLIDVEITDFNTVTSLDHLFERVLTEFPPSLQKGASIPDGAPLHFAQQRDLILLCFNFRRARLHRPFLLHDTDNPRNEPSRRQCLASARIVLSISSEMLEGSSTVDRNQDFGSPLAYRAGLVISGMFMACAILALNAGLIWNRTTGNAHANPQTGAASSEMHDEITRACRVLAKAGEKSTFAANLLRNLVGVLKQYSVKDIDDLVTPRTTLTPNSEYSSGNNDPTLHAHVARDQPQSSGDTTNIVENLTMWNDFFATMPEMEGYDQLFAGLDYYCGPT